MRLLSTAEGPKKQDGLGSEAAIAEILFTFGYARNKKGKDNGRPHGGLPVFSSSGTGALGRPHPDTPSPLPFMCCFSIPLSTDRANRPKY